MNQVIGLKSMFLEFWKFDRNGYIIKSKSKSLCVEYKIRISLVKVSDKKIQTDWNQSIPKSISKQINFISIEAVKKKQSYPNKTNSIRNQ